MKIIAYLFLHPIYIWIIVIIQFIILYIVYKKRIVEKFIGRAGEYWTKKELKKLDKTRYLVLNNILIKNENKHSQIDHIVVSDYGIFVIETKHWSGIITGNKYSSNWEIKHGINKYTQNNPIHQNYGHIKALEKLLSINTDSFISIICITSRSKLNIDDKNVIPIYELIPLINSYRKQIITNKNELYSHIKSKIIKNNAKRKQHINNINSNKRKLDINICPYCNHELVRRKSKEGHEFIGCSNYPNCTYTRNIDDKINKYKDSFWKYYK